MVGQGAWCTGHLAANRTDRRAIARAAALPRVGTVAAVGATAADTVEDRETCGIGERFEDRDNVWHGLVLSITIEVISRLLKYFNIYRKIFCKTKPN